MEEGYLRPEHFVFSTAIGVLTSLLINVAMTSPRPTETEGRYTMVNSLDIGEWSAVPQEIFGYSQSELATALTLMEDSMGMGQKARITLCTEGMPTEEELDQMFQGMKGTGCHLSRPTAGLVEGIPTTEFVLRKGSPQWQIIIPLLIPLFTIGLVAWGITRIESITKALVPLMLIGFGGLILLAITLRKPAERIAERVGAKYLPRTAGKKALAAR